MVLLIKRQILAALSAKFQRIVFVPFLYTLMTSTGLILSIWRRSDLHLDAKTDLHSGNSFETYDFIIVGAGTAGCLLANRLSQYYNVLLLEAGGEPSPLQTIPGFAFTLYGYPEIDWNHRSIPQTGASLISVNQQSSLNAGKGLVPILPIISHIIFLVWLEMGMGLLETFLGHQKIYSASILRVHIIYEKIVYFLGGSGNLNLMLYLRGNPRDYDNWAHILDDPSWSYEEMLPIFKKHENYRDRNANPRYHGFKGELGIELPDLTALGEDFVRSGQELGYPEIDVNAHHDEGFFKLYHTTQNGVRSSPHSAFIKPISHRKQLTVRKYALVNKILFKEGNHEVYGVEYERHGSTRTALCSKEIIVSAGALTSPKLLMLSGIGPRKHLEEFWIPVKHDLPVGLNLQDHMATHLGPFFINKPKTTMLERDLTAEQFIQWVTKGTGILSSSQIQASAVLSSNYAKARGEGNWPDIHLLISGTAIIPNIGDFFQRALNFKANEVNEYYRDAANKDSFHIFVSGARPYSRGYVKLGGRSPYDNLVIDPNYFNDPEGIDIKVLVEGIKRSMELVENTPTFRNLGAHFTNVSLPGCENYPFRSDAYWECYARRNGATLHHFCGTTAMGKGSHNSVVDPELRVHGVANLRVIDTSVIPTIIVTNTQAVAYGIAEKGAEMILRYWTKQPKINNGFI